MKDASRIFFSTILVIAVAFALAIGVFLCWPVTARADDPIRFLTVKGSSGSVCYYNRNEYYHPSKSDETQDESNIVPNQDDDQQQSSSNDTDKDEGNNDSSNSEQLQTGKAQASLPSRYLLTQDKLTSTSVKDQGRVGSCWAFGPIAAAESSLINDGLADSSVDLSEMHFTWFEHTSIASAAGSTNPVIVNSKLGEGFSVVNANGTSAQIPSSSWKIANLGGYASAVYKLFATSQGPTTEAACPYNPIASSAPVAASTGDWSVPDNQRFTERTFDLLDCNIMPGVYFKNRGTSTVGINAVKSEISQGRCVASGIHVSGEGRELSIDSAYTKDGYSYMYTYNEEKTSHEVTIVGYDDNIPATSFALTDENGVQQIPAGNGAFLVKDSAGENFALRCDGTARTPQEVAAGTGGGYYWISYYDKGIAEQLTLKFKAPTGQKCYAYDYVGNATNVVQEYKEEPDDESNKSNSSEENSDKSNGDNENQNKNSTFSLFDFINKLKGKSQSNDGPLYEANIYTAQEDLKVCDLSFESLGNTDSLSVEVRLLEPDEEGNFTDITKARVLASKNDLRFDYGGYHRVSLEDAPPIKAGNKFAICIYHKLDDGNYALPYTTSRRAISDENAGGYKTNGCIVNCNNVVARGESVVFYGDTVTDLVDAASCLDANYTYSNFTLNAYTSPATEEDFDNFNPPSKNWFQQLLDNISNFFSK